ncbi:MAG: lysophospholipid acyltransferase family protein [Microscillaceae bacterium]
MFRRFALWMFKRTGWELDQNLPAEIRRCVVVAAPHTSNWDLWYTMAAFAILRLKIRFTIKKEWMRFPFNLINRPMGGIAVDRRPRTPDKPRPSLVEAMTQLFEDQKELILLFTPEGSRSRREKWKTGFYTVAKNAGVPICLGYVDYKLKKAGIGKTLYPSDFEKDMREIMAFYQKITARFPEKFSVDLDFV